VPQDRWYKDGLFYEVSIRQFADSNGDGIGDLRGLIRRLDHLAGLGATCLWLLPFQPSPLRDDGYDVTDYFAVHPDLGDLGDFVDLIHEADARDIRVIVDLVINHTSNEHPWFLAAREGHDRYRDYYVWADEEPEDAREGMVFPGVQETTWSYDAVAGKWYFHRFYDFQPDLNVANPQVREEIQRIISFWIELGVAGFRMDAVPFIIEPAGAKGRHPGPDFSYLEEFRDQMSWWRRDAILLGEANVQRDEVQKYFGAGGMHMLFNFQANQSLWLALAREDARPLVTALQETAGIPNTDQWANFLRNHDEIDLGRLQGDERSDTFAAFGPDPWMQAYGRGIRRRLGPMLGGDERRLALAFSLLLSQPGTPVLYYGDEVAMHDDLSRPERMSVRTPMDWGAVDRQNADPDSPLNRLRGSVQARRLMPEFGRGSWEALDPGDPSILALRFTARGRCAIALHNLSSEPRTAKVDADGAHDVLSDRRYEPPSGGIVELDGYGYRWLRAPEAR
jgi:maltose alpha-D-glucosyltransferase/alpha-amylase